MAADDKPGRPDDDEAMATWRAAAAAIDEHRLADAHRLLSPLIDRDDLAPETLARILLDWGWLLGATQRYREAAASLDRVIALTAEMPALRAEALLESGIVARYEGRFADAEALLAEASEMSTEQQDRLRTGQCLAQLAAVAHQRHRFADAAARLTDLAAVLDRCPPGDRTEQLRADLSHRLGVSARIAHDFDRARELLVEAEDRYARLGRRIGVANAGRELAAVLDQLGDRPGAERAYHRAFAGYLRAGRRLGAAHVARRLGQLRMVDVDQDDPAAAAYARRRFRQALRLGAGEPANLALCELLLARVDRLSGDLDAAEARLAALPYGEGPDAAWDLSQAALEWGMVARARGDRRSALEFFAQALLPLDEDSDPSATSIAHYQLAHDLILDDQVEAARDHAVAAFTLSERAGRRLRDPSDRETFYRDQRQTYILAMHCAARAGDGSAAFSVATAARAEAVAGFIRSGARFTDELRDLVAQIRVAGTGELPRLYGDLDRLTSVELRRSLTPEPAGLAETRAALPPGGHALLIDVLEDENTICSRIWLPPDGPPHVDEVVLPAAVRHWLDRYHAAEESLAAAPQNDELTALGAAIIPPGLAEALRAGDAPPLVVSTGGLLGPVPVAAVRVGSRYLAELARVVVVPAITLWTAIRSRPVRAGTGFLAYLDPELDGTRRERTALAAAFPQARLLPRDQVRPELAGAADRAAVLLSVHGTAVSGLGQSLMLAPDDPLTAAELLTCRLPEAVLMPACWAGRLHLRTATEPLGLPTAALLAGARWVLAGTVDVNATTTATLLGAFYRRLAVGRAPIDALREVQLGYLHRRGGAAPPSLWAGLSIVGDGFVRGS
ncbi:CHAT domain-containing protein [Actinoplanes auranticolor]|uniref:CHAT domain-containing protein n=1 Tax=Actinoplanes auranticolor TaxID=47988 RepID=A0A919S8Z6_9ACTN|nr:CHAT domain-containing protein [Actinoplanes auranticolor]GIM66963.1 hypothetical protein Aau02nite_25310 [Actinoplanes auranticolor]